MTAAPAQEANPAVQRSRPRAHDPPSFRATNQFGNIRPCATGAIQFTLAGPGTLIGEYRFALVGGAARVKAGVEAGMIRYAARQLVRVTRVIALAVASPDL